MTLTAWPPSERRQGDSHLSGRADPTLVFAEVLRARGKGVFQIVEDIHVPGASLDAITADSGQVS